MGWCCGTFKTPRVLTASKPVSTVVILCVLVLSLISPTTADAVNVALNKPITAMYSCGEFGREDFNTLSDSPKSFSDRTRHKCAAFTPGNGAGSNGEHYPPPAMVDGNLDTWWQSASLIYVYAAKGPFESERTRKLEALIDLNLQQEFIVEQLNIRFGDAMSPNKVAVLKSLDGKTFEPWLYIVSDARYCQSFFGVNYKLEPSSQTDVICMVYVANNVAPGDSLNADLTSIPSALKEWKRVKHLKVKFYDMMYIYKMANTFNHYAVREMEVLAECPCNGLQTDCQPSPTTGVYECICGGNTMGRFCELCMDLFNQYKFEYGKSCSACNCFGHATSCFYEPSVEANGQSLDTDMNRKGGGVCLECADNTAGNNCEKCVSTYYRPVGVEQTSADACVPCDCSVAGSTTNPVTGIVDCIMNNDEPSSDGKVPGDCYCKTNVEGSKCSQCKAGFYNLQQGNADGCTACKCFMQGTVAGSPVCTPDSVGQCSCKANVQGRACNECKDGFYGLLESNVDGCQPCNCDIGGSVNQVCDKETGECTCRSDNIEGRTCSSVKEGFFYPYPHSIFVEIEDIFVLSEWKRDSQYAGFSGKGYAVGDSGESMSLLVTIPSNTAFNNTYVVILTYRSPTGTTTSSTVSITVTSAVDTSPVALVLPPCLSEWCQFSTTGVRQFKIVDGLNLVRLSVTTGPVLLDKLVFLPEEFLQLDPNVLPNPLPAGCDLLTNTLPTVPEDRTACEQNIFTLTMYYYRAPFPCGCHATGSLTTICATNGGTCFCKTGVMGRTCSECFPDHYNLGPTGCTPCDCDDLGSICDTGTGQCQCPENTVGLTCDTCLTNYWDWTQGQGCKDCKCHPLGSAQAQCGLQTGLCTCSPGVEGDKCDVCRDGFHTLSGQGCTTCSCGVAGSVDQNCNKTSGQCSCKANVGGVKCTSCLPGTFNLHVDNTEGCLECICMGITSDCTAGNVKLSFDSYPLSLISAPDPAQAPTSLPNLKLVTESANPVGPAVTVTVQSGENQTSSLVASVQGRLYWQMPATFVTSLLDIYGTDVKATVNYMMVDGASFPDPKAVMLSSDGSAIHHPFVMFGQGFDTEVVVSLKEAKWRQPGSSVPMSRSDFLKALAKVQNFLMPASFSSGSSTVRLSKLQFNTASVVGVANPAVEQCVCGEGYAGKSCEDCAPGYKRTNVSTSEYFGQCVRCECNSHAQDCDADSGVCTDCKDNTAGASCELCAFGFYGDATQGLPTDCTQCPCFEPRVVNASCASGAECQYCSDGYVGALCNQCDVFYYGNPQVQGGTCSACSCNGNSDTCNSVTGVCDSCASNTVGNNCESCASGFFGNATLQNCAECQCPLSTSTSSICDAVSGQCVCVTGVGGRTCDQCLDGYWGFNSQDFVGCRACDCLEAGSQTLQCDPDTGACTCKESTSGDKCDACDENYFGLPDQPCQACNCDPTGTLDGSTCNQVSGQCECKDGVGGRRCDACLAFYVDFGVSGCTECGVCQKTLGGDVAKLQEAAEGYLNVTLGTLEVQQEDSRLQNISVVLTQSLEQLGLAGGDVSSIRDIVSNIQSKEQTLLTNVQTTSSQVNALSSSSSSSETRSDQEVIRHSEMKNTSDLLLTDVVNFESGIGSTLQYMTQNDASASALRNQGSNAGNLVLDFDSETAAVNNIMTKVSDTVAFDTIYNNVLKQKTDTDSTVSEFTSLDNDVTSGSERLSTLVSRLNTESFQAATSDISLSQASSYKSQAEDLLTAVNEILSDTTDQNSVLLSTFTKAGTAASNTDAIYNGDATVLMTGQEYLPFPSGVNNYETGLRRVQTSIPNLNSRIDTVGQTVANAENKASTLAGSLATIQSTSQNINSVGTDAVAAISHYEEVIKDLNSAVSKGNDARDILQEVQNEATGDALQTLSQSFSVEKASSETFRTTIFQLDYQPEVLQNSVTAANARLDAEDAAWGQVDPEVVAMVTAAQEFNSQIADNLFDKQITNAKTTVQGAINSAAEILNVVETQTEVLNQKEAEINTMEQQVAQVKELSQTVNDRLKTHQDAFSGFTANIDFSNSLKTSITNKAQSIEDKINLLESKLADVESVLARLKQPVGFSGDEGVQLTNPQAGTSHVSDDLLLELRTPATLKDGVVFFAEGENANELELGLSERKIFFEFHTGLETVRVTSPADICDNCWLGVSATRYGAVGHLTVTALNNGGLVSSSATGRLDTNTREIALAPEIYVGPLPTSKETSKVLNRGFEGCVANVRYQGQPVTLWTSVLSSNQDLACCESPPTIPVPGTRSNGVSFTGYSYIVVPGTGISFSQLTSVVLEFRTFSADAAIFVVVSEDGNTKYSLQLVAGILEWKIQTSGQEYILQSVRKFNTGQWAKVTAEKNPSALTLRVTFIGEDASNEDSTALGITTFDLTALDGANIILGSPSDPLAQGYTFTDNNFAGCMRSIETAVNTVTQPLSLAEPIAQAGITTDGCYDSVIPGLVLRTDTSYAQASISQDLLTQVNSVEFNIVTTEFNGILLYIRPPSGDRNLYIAVFGGNIIVKYQQDNTGTVLGSNQHINDGQVHNVRIDFQTLRVSLKVDGNVFEEASASLSVRYLTFGTGSALFVGGVDNTAGLEPVADSLIGNIADLRVNDQSLPLIQSGIALYRDIALDGTPTPPASPPDPPITEPIAITCANAPVLQTLERDLGARLKGDSYITWVSYSSDDLRLFLTTEFSMNVEFATYKPNNVLFYVADSLSSPATYFTIYMVDGLLYLKMRTDSQAVQTINLSLRYDDGKRHALSILRINDFAVLNVEAEKDYVNTGTESSVTTQINIPDTTELYLGGIGQNDLSASPLPDVFKEEGENVFFAGAFYLVSLLSQSSTSVLDFTQLDVTTYPLAPASANAGVSLSGTNSYLDLGKISFSQEFSFSVDLTTTSQSALLLVIQESETKFIIMDYTAPQLRLFLSPSFAGVTTNLMLVLDEALNLCDNVKHKVGLEFVSNMVILSVDGVEKPSKVISASHAVQSLNLATVTVGGFKDALPSSLDGVITTSVKGCVTELSVDNTSYNPSKYWSESSGAEYGCPV